MLAVWNESALVVKKIHGTPGKVLPNVSWLFLCVNYIIYIFSMLMTQFRHALPAHHYLSASSTLLLCDIKYTFVECISDLGAAHFVPSSYIIISMPLFHLVSFSLFRSIADVL